MNKTSTISLCMPTFNSMKWLEQRVNSILEQSRLPDEIVVVDGESTDGTVGFLQSHLGHLPGYRLISRPADGIYQAINTAIQASKSQYIYIATSDDTMAPNCLESLAKALDENPDCGLAHCRLRVTGDQAERRTKQWENCSVFSLTCKGSIYKVHKRLAPMDGLLHLLGTSIYVSLTQLMIRITVFERIGFFPTCWGSIGDHHWEMLAGFYTNTIHVPNTWAGWHRHHQQASASVKPSSEEYQKRFAEIHTVVLSEILSKELYPQFAGMFDNLQDEIKRRKMFVNAFSKFSKLRKVVLLVKLLRTNSKLSMDVVYAILRRKHIAHSILISSVLSVLESDVNPKNIARKFQITASS